MSCVRFRVQFFFFFFLGGGVEGFQGLKTGFGFRLPVFKGFGLGFRVSGFGCYQGFRAVFWGLQSALRACCWAIDTLGPLTISARGKEVFHERFSFFTEALNPNPKP